MASFDDGNTCTIETDSADSSMTPTSTIGTLFDGQRDNYLNYLSKMPMQLQIEDTDAVIINAEGDMQGARSFQRQLLKTILNTQDAQCFKPKVNLISEIPGFRQEILKNVAVAFEKTNYIFLFATKNLCDPKSILSRLERILSPFIEKKNIIPVNTKSKKFRDYTLSPMYSGVKPIEFWSTDQFFVRSVQKLFEMKIDQRLKREKDLEHERKECYLKLKEQQLYEHLGHQLHQGKTMGSPMASLPRDMHGLKLRENSNFSTQNQSLQNPGPQVESILNSQIQVDGPTSSIILPSSHLQPHPQQIYPPPPPVNYGFGEIPDEHMLSRTTTLESGNQRWFYTKGPVPSSSYHHTTSSSSPENQTSSMEVQPPISHFVNHPVQYPQFTQIQHESASNQAFPMVYSSHSRYPSLRYPFYPYSQSQFDPSQFIRTPGASKPSYTMETSHRQSVPGGTPCQPSTSSKSSSQTSDANFQFSPHSSVPQSSSAPSTQSGVIQNIITINIQSVGTAAIGSNPTLIKKTTDSSDEDDSVDHDGDSNSSDSLSNPESSDPGLHKERSEKEAPVFLRSSGRRVSTADTCHPSSTEQPVSACNVPENNQSSDIQESQRNTESTHVKYVPSERDEYGSIMTHETVVKQIFED